jgi:hypothetical protein
MKYIDAEKLIAEIDNIIEMAVERWDNEQVTGVKKLRDLLDAKIASLQQEQPEFPNGKFVFPKYLYARTKDNKTIDMSYAPQDMTAVEYIRNDFVEQEQPEVELKEYLSAKLFSLGADLIRHKPCSFNRGLNVGMTKAYDDILKKINTRKEE